MTEGRDKPGVIAPPPLIYLGAFLFALALDQLWTLPMFSASALWPGVAFIALGVGVAVWGARTLHVAGTNVSPYHPSTAVVDSGPFRFSRNPLYVGMTLSYTGLTLAINTWWGIIVLIPALLVMHFGVIRREERYLEGKFGESYRRYRSEVRRYL
jgi:protein-S-isoprenylcysteine O-methyltransferase Ste14